MDKFLSDKLKVARTDIFHKHIYTFIFRRKCGDQIIIK